MTDTEMLEKINAGYCFLHMSYRLDDFIGLVEQSVKGTKINFLEDEAAAEQHYKVLTIDADFYLAAINKEQVRMMEKWALKAFRKHAKLRKEQVGSWDAKSERLLRIYYPTESMVVLKALLKRNERSILNKAQHMGLKKKQPLKGRVAV